MTLLKCPECTLQISDRAAACPHCGFPLRQEAGATSSGSTPNALRGRVLLDLRELDAVADSITSDWLAGRISIAESERQSETKREEFLVGKSEEYRRIVSEIRREQLSAMQAAETAPAPEGQRELVVRDLAELEARTGAITKEWLDGRISHEESQKRSKAAIDALFAGKSSAYIRVVAEVAAPSYRCSAGGQSAGASVSEEPTRTMRVAKGQRRRFA